MTKRKKKELFVLFIYFIAISLIALVLKFRFLEISLLFFGIPGFYYLLKHKKYTRKILIETILFTIPFVIILNTFAYINHAWYEYSIFPFRIFGLFPLESFIFGFNYYLFITIFYEYFFDKYNKPKFNKRFKYLLTFLLSVLLLTCALLLLVPSLLEIPYFYAVLMFLTFILIIAVTKISPVLFKRSLLLSLFLLIPSFLHELVSLELGHWSFEEGYHIGYLQIFKFSIPIEELIWLPLVPIGVVLFYEVFHDDGK